jgi:phosphoribosyl-ATP pyrophosphohydrolase/phosphoribosyl-AMP cyclohydrolase/histidinol dehydrogenase
MFPLLPRVESLPDVSALAVIGQFLLPFGSFEISKYFVNQFPNHVKINVDARRAQPTVDEVVELLNNGISQVVVTAQQANTFIVEGGLPASRFIVEGGAGTLNSDVVVSAPLAEVDFKQASQNGNRLVYIDVNDPSQSVVESLAQGGYIAIVASSKLLTTNDSDKVAISGVFVNTLTTDRPDGLFTTLITTAAPAYTALGVVYSSKASIAAAIAEGEGVYQSRKRPQELWYKGKTSGATQKLLKLEKDCDSDLVKFIVEPRKGYGFCHLESNFTCFNDGNLKDGPNAAVGSGLGKLDETLQSRLELLPEGSYTKRLFNDNNLLVAKMKEELDELIEAGTNQQKDNLEVAWEAADLLYFVLVWCVKHGVRLADLEKNLDIKSDKVTRRKGDAKPAYVASEVAPAAPALPTYELETLHVKMDPKEAVERALTRPVQKTADIMKLVLPIIEKVKKEGDKALIELTAKFDGVSLTAPILEAPFLPDLMDISAEMKEAIDLSMANIEKFHRAQQSQQEVMTVETSPGVFCSRFAKPIENVGLYVPGGTAVLPSTAMMLGVPAKVAGCSNIILASPPARATGRLTPEVVYVAHKLGAKCIVMAGGAQAVTAMAYGTESVIKCDKILGPGNQFVTAAKMYVQNDTQALCSIDMPAGPSEVLVIADGKADADFVASDLLSQAEHGVDSQVILIGVALTDAKRKEIAAAIKRQAEVLPRREIVAKCLSHSYTLLVDTFEEAFDISNRYAPEHLILQIDNAASFVPHKIENAGSVFVGELSPESCGDYSSGTNHTLPTYGYARQYSGVNLATFQKFITSQEVTKQGLKSIGKAVMTLAAVEGLEAHRNAVQVRMDKLELH